MRYFVVNIPEQKYRVVTEIDCLRLLDVCIIGWDCSIVCGSILGHPASISRLVTNYNQLSMQTTITSLLKQFCHVLYYGMGQNNPMWFRKRSAGDPWGDTLGLQRPYPAWTTRKCDFYNHWHAIPTQVCLTPKTLMETLYVLCLLLICSFWYKLEHCYFYPWQETLSQN